MTQKFWLILDMVIGTIQVHHEVEVLVCDIRALKDGLICRKSSSSGVVGTNVHMLSVGEVLEQRIG